MADSRYRITERVAAGGMAEVFRGVAESMRGFKKNIAIKRILPSLTKNKKFVAMFLDEARLSLALQHANIVQVFDIGHTDDTYFIVMEYVDGADLKALLEWRRRINRRVPIAHGLYMILEICKGLAYAHEVHNPETGGLMGIVHRDISPPNVLISKQGEVKVVDFGLAKATSQVEITDPGVVKGKMSYLSPEAARGEEVDHRADIFAVGILLYELLTGKRLFYGETDYQTVELVRNAKIPPIKPQNPQVEPELEDIVRKALAKRKEDRYQNANDIQDALAQYAYSRGLKVIARDIAELVRQCLEDRRMQSGEAKPKTSIIDHLLQDEIAKFTSVEEEEQDAGARPLSADELAPRPTHGTFPPPPSDGDFVDPRAWAEERLTPVLGIAEVDAMEARKTSRDMLPAAVPPAQRRTGAPRMATPAPVRPDPMDQTPGPETLASVLEPTPGPEALSPEALASTLEPPPTRSVAIRAHRPRKARNFLIGAAIGIVVLVGIVVAARKNAPNAPAPQQPPPAATQTP
jgi:eukaryotic-like serine/threonine-protein kinase